MQSSFTSDEARATQSNASAKGWKISQNAPIPSKSERPRTRGLRPAPPEALQPALVEEEQEDAEGVEDDKGGGEDDEEEEVDEVTKDG